MSELVLGQVKGKRHFLSQYLFMAPTVCLHHHCLIVGKAEAHEASPSSGFDDGGSSGTRTLLGGSTDQIFLQGELLTQNGAIVWRTTLATFVLFGICLKIKIKMQSITAVLYTTTKT